jgi:predicted nucleotidyltransferase component of viral defense system
MFIEKLKQIVKMKSIKNPELLRVILKMELIEYVLQYIYTSKYRNLIFKGGTCLNICYDLPRLSEDIDLDFVNEIDISSLKEDLISYFKTELAYDRLYASLTNNNQTITLKFPVLRDLGLANQSESDLLYIKLDIQKSPFFNITTDLVPRKNYVIKAYSLPLLFTGKVNAIFTRNKLVGKENKFVPKGRDYFDLLWFLQKGIRPDISMLEQELNISSNIEFKVRLDQRVIDMFTKYKDEIINDLKPFIENPDILNQFVESFLPLYLKYSLEIFDYRVPDEVSRRNYLIDELNSIIKGKKLQGKEIMKVLNDMDTYKKGSNNLDILGIYNYLISL